MEVKVTREVHIRGRQVAAWPTAACRRLELLLLLMLGIVIVGTC